MGMMGMMDKMMGMMDKMMSMGSPSAPMPGGGGMGMDMMTMAGGSMPPAPPAGMGENAGEPSIGFNPVTKKVMYISTLQTLQLTLPEDITINPGISMTAYIQFLLASVGIGGTAFGRPIFTAAPPPPSGEPRPRHRARGSRTTCWRCALISRRSRRSRP